MNNNKMTLLFDATILVDGELDNGARSGVYFVAKNVLEGFLKKPGVNVVLLAYPTRNARLHDLVKKYHYKASILDEASATSKSVFFFLKINRQLRKRFFKLVLLRKFFSSIEFVLEFGYEKIYNWTIFRKHLEEKLQDVHFFFSPLTDAPHYIEQNKQIKKFIVLYDVIPFKLPEYECQKNKKWSHYFLNESNYYFAISQSTKKDFCEIYPNINKDHIWVTYLAASETFTLNKSTNQLETVKNKYCIPASKKYVFSLCTLEPRKNLIRAVKTFVLFAEKNYVDDMIFVLGGGAWNAFEERLKKEADIADLYDKYVIRAGYIDDADLPILYSNAEWFVYTSQYEGFGLPPLEAMQCGCPVITSNNSSLPEVVGDAGIMIDWDSDDQHIKAYEDYYFNEQLRKENRQKGLSRAKDFSWDKTIDEMLRRMSNE